MVDKLTDGWGVDLVFECSGNEKAAAGVFAPLCPGGAVVYVGIPLQPIAYDVAAAMVKEARVEHVFRYAHVYPRAIALMASGKLDVKPLITDTFRLRRQRRGLRLRRQHAADVGQGADCGSRLSDITTEVTKCTRDVRRDVTQEQFRSNSCPTS